MHLCHTQQCDSQHSVVGPHICMKLDHIRSQNVLQYTLESKGVALPPKRSRERRVLIARSCPGPQNCISGQNVWTTIRSLSALPSKEDKGLSMSLISLGHTTVAKNRLNKLGHLAILLQCFCLPAKYT